MTDTATSPAGQYVPIDNCHPNPWNPRHQTKVRSQADKELIESIRKHGVLENLLVRPLPADLGIPAAGHYQVLAGERRLRCAIAAGLDQVPCSIRDLDDHEAKVITITENLHRENLHWLEEARGVAGLLEEDWTQEAVAVELGRSVGWVARRKRLLDLSPAWLAIAEDPEGQPKGSMKGFAAAWGASHFEQIAVLETEAQDDLLTPHMEWNLRQARTAKAVAQLIAAMTRALSGFPWPLKDPELYPAAGACSTCPFRSSQNPGLFDDQEAAEGGKSGKKPRGHGADRCLNPKCADEKGTRFVERRLAELKAEHGKVLLIKGDHDGGQAPAGALNSWEVQKVKEGDKGAVPAVIASGRDAGRVQWVKPPFSGRAERAATKAAGEKPEKTPLADRKAQLGRRRMVHAIDAMKVAIVKEPAPALEVCIRLAITAGTKQTNDATGGYHYGFDELLPRCEGNTAQEARRLLLEACRPARSINAQMEEEPDADDDEIDEAEDSMSDEEMADAGAAHASFNRRRDSPARVWESFVALGRFTGGVDATAEMLAAYLWARVLPTLYGRMTPTGMPDHVKVAYAEAERTAALVGLEAKVYLDQATVALPDPKGWAKEEEAAKATKKAKAGKREEGVESVAVVGGAAKGAKAPAKAKGKAGRGKAKR